MKVFLDTTRLLARYTNNLVDEIWNYIKDGKLVQTAVLLLAAQAHLRSSCRKRGNITVDGFTTIMDRITKNSMNLQVETGQNQKELQHLMLPALLLVNIVARAGKDLDSCIRKHVELPQAEVLERVSSILKAYDFMPPGECVILGNLRPYRWWRMPNGVLPEKHGNMAEAAVGTAYVCPADEKAARNKLPKRLGLECTWRDFFPYWRSVLASRYPVKVYPAHAQEEVMAEIGNYGRNSIVEGSSPIPNGNVPLLARRSSQVRNRRESKMFGTGAMTLLKVLKHSRV